MATPFDFISTTDKPALLAIDNPDYLSIAKGALAELGYKVHAIEMHEEFSARFAEAQYQVLVVSETFGGTADNSTLRAIQEMPMGQRRHTVVFLLGASFETLNAMQAFQQSVHAVINYSETGLLPQLVQKVVADNNLFLQTYRETARRILQSRG